MDSCYRVVDTYLYKRMPLNDMYTFSPPTLFKRDAKKNIQQWTIFVEGNTFYTVEGIKDGKQTKSAPTVCEAKNVGKSNETSPEQQATNEATAKWRLKLDKGYTQYIEFIDKPSSFFKPQLAFSWDDYKEEVNLAAGEWYISPKLDGVRCIITKDGAFSRNGKPFVAFPHILEALKPFFAKYPNIVLDGEIYTHKLHNDFNKIISLAKKTKLTTEDIVESAKYLQYWIFDIFNHDDSTMKFHQRLDFIKENVITNSCIRFCPHVAIASEENLELQLAKYLVDGYEGVMLKYMNASYENKRSKNLLKYKKFHEEEFEIISIEEGEGNRAGMFGRAVLKAKNGSIFESNARGSEEFYRQLLRDKDKLVGQIATVRYQNLTPAGVPRFPVIIAIRNYE